MCGIAGIVSKTGIRVEPASLKKMCDTIAHRGPDDAGYVFFRPRQGDGKAGGYYSCFTEPQFHVRNQHIAPFGGDYFIQETQKLHYLLGMGHRRLAILDLSVKGHQPMPTPDRRYWISFNGEIYNFPELRSQLRSLGYQFYSDTDTEVILYLWEEFGVQCLDSLNGSFALAVYDMQENVLTLARDRYGSRPLYYYHNEDFFVYGSEIKALFASGLCKARISVAGLQEYCTFQNIFSNRTLFQNIFLLGQGEVLSLRPGMREEPAISRFFRGFPAVDCEIGHGADLQEELIALFSAAVKRQLISDVEIGAYLSGGMDSGAIVAAARRHIPRLTTFTCGFDVTNVSGIEQGFDERSMSEQLAYLLQTEHYEVVLHSGDMPAIMEQLSWHVDDLRVGMCHQNWYAAKLASRFVKVCLGGAGGDELFAGYPWRYRCCALASKEDACEMYFRSWHRLLPYDELPALFHPDIVPQKSCCYDSFRERFMAIADVEQLSDSDNLLQRIFHFEFQTFLHGILLIEDKISMAHGLEVRTPFLDNPLADFAFRLPPEYKLNVAALLQQSGRGYVTSADGKHILRKAMRYFLPASYTQQPKQGFSSPDGSWYRGESMEYIKEILWDPRTRSRPWFQQKNIDRYLHEHFAGQRNHRLLIWSLLSLEWLQRHFCDAA